MRWVPLALVLCALGVVPLIAALDGLARVTVWYVAQLVVPVVCGLVFLGTAIYWLARRRWKSPACLSTLLVAGVCGTVSTLWTLGVLPIRYPASLEDTGPAAHIRVPLDGPVRVAWGGDELDTNYHAATPDQRWAYDLVVEPYLVGTEQLEDYGCYGRDVLAPADGQVTVARDGLPDHVPGAVSNDYENPTGNTVAIRLDHTDTYLVLAHLAEGSVAVAAGDRVTEGQRVGACGNSGNTSEPHVHIHHQRQDPADHPHGFAEGLPLYFRDHDGPEMPAGGLTEEGGEPVPTGDVVTHRE